MDLSRMRLTDIDSELIQQIVEQRVSESSVLDFKSTLVPPRSNKDKVEYLKDVCAFANTRGGVIIWGITEEDGQAIELSGAGEHDYDSAILQLESVIRTGLMPLLRGIQSTVIAIDDKHCLVQKVPRSPAAPHMVSAFGHEKFYSRQSRGNAKMGLYEIRDSFISNEGRSERMASFRDARVESIIKRKWPIPLGLANLYIIHLIPEFPIDRGLDAQDILRRRADFPLIWPNGPANAHFNADGVLFHDGTYDYTGSHCYCQVYRSGTIESVGPCAFLPTGEWNNIATVELEQNTLDSLSSYISGLADLGIDPPYHVFISLINVGGWVIFSGDPLHQRMPKIDREHILLPPVAIDGSETSLDAVLQSPFNWMWNAGGRARCPHYDEHGMLKRS